MASIFSVFFIHFPMDLTFKLKISLPHHEPMLECIFELGLK